MGVLPDTVKGRELARELRDAMVGQSLPIVHEDTAGAPGRLLRELIEVERLRDRAAAKGALTVDYGWSITGHEAETVRLAYRDGSWGARMIFNSREPSGGSVAQDEPQADALRRARDSIDRLSRIKL
jgi:hypothetical protein